MTHIRQLHIVTPHNATLNDLIALAKAISQTKVDFVQLRCVNATAQFVFEAGRELICAFSDTTTRVLINDRLDVAMALGVGVHLKGSSLPVREARRLVGPEAIIGRSVHSAKEAVLAAAEGASYVTFGHIFPSASKPGLAPRGVVALQNMVDQINIPVIAIGGIDLANIENVLASGCAGIAVIGAVCNAPDPGKSAKRLVGRLRHLSHNP